MWRSPDRVPTRRSQIEQGVAMAVHGVKKAADAGGELYPSTDSSAHIPKDRMAEEERSAVHPGSGVRYTYELPFVALDREADMRQAYARFEQILEERS